MATTHIVEQGEHIPGIAAKFGFSSFRTIWDHPENAELKKLRKNPNILFPGDSVFIPDKGEKEFSRSTEKLHRFEAIKEELQLRVKVLDLNDKPVSGPCFLVSSQGPNLMSESDHIFEGFIESDVKDAEMQFPQSKPRIKEILAIGSLDPIDKQPGQRERLNNLGYFAGFSETNTEQFKWAVEEFQADHLKEIGILKPTGECDPKTQAVLTKVYGS